jgi:putative addiction module antidote
VIGGVVYLVKLDNCNYSFNSVLGKLMMQIKLRNIGNAIGTTFPKEVLEKVHLKEDDSLSLVVMEDGIKLVTYDPNFEQVMAAYQQGASQYRNAMRQLADG